MVPAVLIAALSLGSSSGAALAFSDEPVPDGMQSQFSDPDEAVENLANRAVGQSGTEVSAGDQIPTGAKPAPLAPATPGDGEPVNPGWPAWMIWHQQ
jgi:hypothetical protein